MRRLCGCLPAGWLAIPAAMSGMLFINSVAHSQDPIHRFRIATFNCSLNRNSPGELIRDLSGGTNDQARRVARILRIVRPQILLLNEFDFDTESAALKIFRSEYLEAKADWCPEPPLTYPAWFAGAVNTGLPSGRDLDHDRRSDGPGDAIGFGQFPGQYGMAVLSQFPLQLSEVRTFQNLLWKDLPDAVLPSQPSEDQGNVPVPWYSADDLQILRLSSKSHWDVPVLIGQQTLHILASHPTPPAFDGPEDRNGRRNHDEIRLWAEYLTPGTRTWLRDDQGKIGPLPGGEKFVLLGDQNADPHDGGSFRQAIRLLLDHPRINSKVVPSSSGAAEASKQQQAANLKHTGPSQEDTADFNDRSVGNLRADYVLPEMSLKIHASGVFWPSTEDSNAELVECSDHRLVWMDLEF